MRKLLAAAAFAAGMGLAASASAAGLLHFNISDIQVQVTNTSNPVTCFGCSVAATPATAPVTFDLGSGDSNTFEFVDFDLHGLGLGGSATLNAILTFDSPISGAVTSGGDADYFKIFIPFLGVFSGGNLTWSPIQPSDTFTTANGSTFKVAFEDLSGVQVGKHVADHITITAGNVVPEPATWALMIGGFGMAGAMLRRRRSAALA